MGTRSRADYVYSSGKSKSCVEATCRSSLHTDQFNALAGNNLQDREAFHTVGENRDREQMHDTLPLALDGNEAKARRGITKWYCSFNKELLQNLDSFQT